MVHPDRKVGIERLWRARKHHASIDAHLRPVADPAGFALEFFYDGVLVLRRHWPTRADAAAHADNHLRDLQRAGWNTHW